VLVNVAGHPVTYDLVRKLWYCDVRVDVGRAYTPMIRLALARYQPNSVPGAELSRIVLADVMSLEPGRSVVIQRKSKKLISFVTLTGYSYKKAGADDGTGPGYAQLILERRNPAIADPVLGWQPVGDPIKMSAFSSRGGQTTWAAREIKIPSGGTHRLLIEQYEVVPEDNRKSSPYILLVKSRGYRLLYQDVIPL
jgi:hypothetical protein